MTKIKGIEELEGIKAKHHAALSKGVDAIFSALNRDNEDTLTDIKKIANALQYQVMCFMDRAEAINRELAGIGED